MKLWSHQSRIMLLFHFSLFIHQNQAEGVAVNGGDVNASTPLGPSPPVPVVVLPPPTVVQRIVRGCRGGLGVPRDPGLLLDVVSLGMGLVCSLAPQWHPLGRAAAEAQAQALALAGGDDGDGDGVW